MACNDFGFLPSPDNSRTIHSKKHTANIACASQSVNVYADDPVYALHNDTSKEVAAYWSTYVTHSDLTAFATPLQFAAWRYIPSTYLLCELDQCIPPQAQEAMVALTESKVKVERLASGHMPMLSMPQKLVEVLEREAIAV